LKSALRAPSTAAQKEDQAIDSVVDIKFSSVERCVAPPAPAA